MAGVREEGSTTAATPNTTLHQLQHVSCILYQSLKLIIEMLHNISPCPK